MGMHIPSVLERGAHFFLATEEGANVRSHYDIPGAVPRRLLKEGFAPHVGPQIVSRPTKLGPRS